MSVVTDPIITTIRDARRTGLPFCGWAQSISGDWELAGGGDTREAAQHALDRFLKAQGSPEASEITRTLILPDGESPYAYARAFDKADDL